MVAIVTPTDLNTRHSPSGGGHPRYISAQRTIGVGCPLMKTNKTDSALIFFLGVHAARPANSAPAPRPGRKPGSCTSSILCACGGSGQLKTREIERSPREHFCIGVWEIQPDSEFGLHWFCGLPQLPGLGGQRRSEPVRLLLLVFSGSERRCVCGVHTCAQSRGSVCVCVCMCVCGGDDKERKMMDG